MVNFIIKTSVWIIQINGQQLNCEIIKDFFKMQRLLKALCLETRDRAWSLQFIFLYKDRIYSLKFKLRSIVTHEGYSTSLDLITLFSTVIVWYHLMGFSSICFQVISNSGIISSNLIPVIKELVSSA